MRRRFFTILSALSLLQCVATATLWACDLSDHTGWTVAGTVRVGIFGRSASVYNESLPYSGSIIGFTSKGARSFEPVTSAFDFAGIYYRHHRWRTGRTYWTLTVPTVYLVAGAAVLPALWLRSRFLIASRSKGCCPHCGYDMRASPDRCPECGTECRPEFARRDSTNPAR